MSYILQTFSGGKLKITDEEFKKIAAAPDDTLIYINSIGNMINKKTIAHCYPESQADEIEDRREQTIGVLHDGTMVKKHFGQWVEANRQVPDDNGKYQPVVIDPDYFPEVRMDCIPTPQEYQKKYAHLPEHKRLELMIAGHNEEIRGEGGFKSLKDIL